jgi:hypothetical protein
MINRIKFFYYKNILHRDFFTLKCYGKIYFVFLKYEEVEA